MIPASERLNRVVALVEASLRSLGYELRPSAVEASPACAAIDICSTAFAGRLCHWPPDTFELQFNDYTTGEVVLLETGTFESDEEAAEYLKRVVDNLAPRSSGA